jgi:serine/threonine-protein kinase
MPERATPTTIGRYELCFELASGGMASVYLARAEGSPGFEKLVALKRIHPHLASEKGYVEMFLDEARIASRITHPNVCSVFDFGEADGEYFIAMEYSRASTAGSWRTPLSGRLRCCRPGWRV